MMPIFVAAATCLLFGATGCMSTEDQATQSTTLEPKPVATTPTEASPAGSEFAKKACNEVDKSSFTSGKTLEDMAAKSLFHRERAVAMAAQAARMNDRWVDLSTDATLWNQKTIEFKQHLETYGAGTQQGLILITASNRAKRSFDRECAAIADLP